METNLSVSSKTVDLMATVKSIIRTQSKEVAVVNSSKPSTMENSDKESVMVKVR